jgi:hypothetical protein
MISISSPLEITRVFQKKNLQVKKIEFIIREHLKKKRKKKEKKTIFF